MAFNPNAFKTSNPLEGVTIRYANELTDYIADEVFGFNPVSKDKFSLYQYDTSNFRYVNSRKSNMAEADVVDYGAFKTEYSTVPYKLKGKVDPSEEQDFDRPMANVEQDVAALVMDNLMIEREVAAADLALTSTNYPAALTSALGAGATWISTGGNPEVDASLARRAVKDSCGKYANACAISGSMYDQLLQAPAVVDRIKFVNGTKPSVDVIKNLLGVDFLHICKAQKNANVEGSSTQTLSDVWNDSALFYVKDPSPRLKKVCYGMWSVRNKFTVRKYVDEKLGSADGPIRFIECAWNWKLHAGAVVSSSDGDFAGGYLLRNVY